MILCGPVSERYAPPAPRKDDQVDQKTPNDGPVTTSYYVDAGAPVCGQLANLRSGRTVYFGMNPLQTELRRLYLFNDHDAATDAPSLIASDERVRAMVLEIGRPADWVVLSALWQRVQTELELPAPAIAVSGIEGYQLWFSLAEPIPATEALAFLDALRLRYLHQIAPDRICMMPNEAGHARLVPAVQPTTGQWSAFVSPDLAGIFADAPGLDVCPSPEAQAKILTRLECIEPALFQSVLSRISPNRGMQLGGANAQTVVAQESQLKPGADPKRFLLDVMNDQTVALSLRIEAAKALLPYS